jgi:transcription elongation GreA/GreB family factor
MDKKTAIKAVIKELERQKTGLETGLRSAERAAVEAPGAMESHSDTTKAQMHTLAANITELIAENDRTMKYLDGLPIDEPEKRNEIKEGTLVKIKTEEGNEGNYFLIPDGSGGISVDIGGESITLITAKTPLGSILLGKKTGETAVLKNKSGERAMKILDIS